MSSDRIALLAALVALAVYVLIDAWAGRRQHREADELKERLHEERLTNHALCTAIGRLTGEIRALTAQLPPEQPDPLQSEENDHA